MLSPKTQAILLLTARFSNADDKMTRPLGIKEWATFAFWLNEQGLSPEQLLHGDLGKTLQGWQHKQVTPDRLESLLNRSTALGLALEKWTRAGLWVLTRSDVAYPSRLKKRLGYDAPPVLFGCGNQSLLKQGGIAVVGSRKGSEQDLERSRALGSKVAAIGLPLISGGARGVDENAMLGSLAVEGTAVGVLSCDLLRTSTSSKYRRHLMHEDLALISSFSPEAGFNAGNAMQRNKYIYCMADNAIVVHSGTKGGTWEGALENLRNQWVPLWVLPSDDRSSGNALLESKGAQRLTDGLELSCMEQSMQPEQDASVGGLLTSSRPADAYPEIDRQPPIEVREQMTVSDDDSVSEIEEKLGPPNSLYDCFLSLLQNLVSINPLTLAELEESLQLNKTQLNFWLKRAVAEGKLQELKRRPKRFLWQPDLFSNDDRNS